MGYMEQQMDSQLEGSQYYELQNQINEEKTEDEETKERLIQKYLEKDRVHEFSRDYYRRTGKITGSLLLAINAMMDEYREKN